MATQIYTQEKAEQFQARIQPRVRYGTVFLIGRDGQDCCFACTARGNLTRYKHTQKSALKRKHGDKIKVNKTEIIKNNNIKVYV